MKYMFFFAQLPELPNAVPPKKVCVCKCVAWALRFSCYSAIRGNNTAVINELSLCFGKDWLGHRFLQCLFQTGLYHLVVFRRYKKASEWEGDWYQCPFKTPAMWPQNLSICWGKAIFRDGPHSLPNCWNSSFFLSWYQEFSFHMWAFPNVIYSWLSYGFAMVLFI